MEVSMKNNEKTSDVHTLIKLRETGNFLFKSPFEI